MCYICGVGGEGKRDILRSMKEDHVGFRSSGKDQYSRVAWSGVSPRDGASKG